MSTSPSGGPAASAAGGHVPALDGLRGLAILLVMLHHFVAPVEPTRAGDLSGAAILYRLFWPGWCGVDLFFVLSGFLITGILLDAKGSPGYFRSFYARRTLRIFPLYYLVLTAALVALPLLAAPDPAELGRVGENHGWLWAYASNIRIAGQGWIFDNAWYKLNHFWSLAVEEQFYLIWPAVVLLTGRRALAAVCWLCAGVALAARWHFNSTGEQSAAYVLTLCRMDSLAVGAWLAVAARGVGLPALVRPARRVFALLAPVAAVLLLRHCSSFEPIPRTVLFTVLGPLFGALLVLTLTSPPAAGLGRLFTSRALCFLGRYSYGLYVFHFLLIPVFSRLFPVPALTERFGSSLPAIVVYIAGSLALSLAAAVLSWHLFEAHFLKLKRYFEYRTAAPIPRKIPAPAVTATLDSATPVPAAAHGVALAGVRPSFLRPARRRAESGVVKPRPVK